MRRLYILYLHARPPDWEGARARTMARAGFQSNTAVCIQRIPNIAILVNFERDAINGTQSNNMTAGGQTGCVFATIVTINAG